MHCFTATKLCLNSKAPGRRAARGKIAVEGCGLGTAAAAGEGELWCNRQRSRRIQHEESLSPGFLLKPLPQPFLVNRVLELTHCVARRCKHILLLKAQTQTQRHEFEIGFPREIKRRLHCGSHEIFVPQQLERQSDQGQG